MKKLYIVDDDIDFLQLMVDLFGKKYHIFTDTRLNVVDVFNFSPDLILLDSFLGNTNSDRVLWELTIAVPDFSIPIILMSGHEVNPTKYPLLVKGFIPKPCSIRVINKTIEEFFAGTLEMPTNSLAK